MTPKTRQRDPTGADLYDCDIVAWADLQARLLRERRLEELDIEHIAEEIEDVGKGEQRELASRLAVLLAHLIKWQHQRERRGSSWQRTIREQRRAIGRRLARTPSLEAMLGDRDWQQEIWSDAVVAALAEAGIEDPPESCPWGIAEVLDQEWLPETLS